MHVIKIRRAIELELSYRPGQLVIGLFIVWLSFNWKPIKTYDTEIYWHWKWFSFELFYGHIIFFQLRITPDNAKLCLLNFYIKFSYMRLYLFLVEIQIYSKHEEEFIFPDSDETVLGYLYMSDVLAWANKITKVSCIKELYPDETIDNGIRMIVPELILSAPS